MTLKTCGRCHRQKPLSQFYASRIKTAVTHAGGYSSRRKECCKTQVRQNRAEQQRRDRERLLVNAPERMDLRKCREKKERENG